VRVTGKIPENTGLQATLSRNDADSSRLTAVTHIAIPDNFMMWQTVSDNAVYGGSVLKLC